MNLKWLVFYTILSLVFVIISLVSISFLTLWERKLLAGIQRRQGPVFVGLFGILQPFSDGLKLAIKAVNIPQGAYYYVFFISSIFSLVLSLTSWAVIPLNHEFSFSDNNFSILFMLAISSLNVYTILFSGWSSNSKYGLLGSIRAGAQMVSYEIPMSLSLFPVVVFGNSFSFQNIVLYQIEKNIWNFYIIPALFIFFVAALAETNRAPFDLPEAESELVAGYNIEYSALLFAIFFLAEYNHIILMSAVTVNIFFGGWSIPWINLDNLVYGFFPNVWLLETFLFVIKTLIVVSFFVVIRASVPRYRFTDLVIICWESFIPILTFFIVEIFVIKNIAFNLVHYTFLIAILATIFYLSFVNKISVTVVVKQKFVEYVRRVINFIKNQIEAIFTLHSYLLIYYLSVMLVLLLMILSADDSFWKTYNPGDFDVQRASVTSNSQFDEFFKWLVSTLFNVIFAMFLMLVILLNIRHDAAKNYKKFLSLNDPASNHFKLLKDKVNFFITILYLSIHLLTLLVLILLFLTADDNFWEKYDPTDPELQALVIFIVSSGKKSSNEIYKSYASKLSFFSLKCY